MLKVLTVITGTYHMQKNHIFINSQWQWINKEKRGEKIKGLIERKILQSPLHSKEIKPAHPKGNQPWKCIGRTDAEAETPILWPSDVKSRLIGKDPEAGKDWGQEEKGTTEDEMVGRHHQLNGHGFEQTLVDSEGQGNLACCCPWGHKELDTIEWLNNNTNL